MNLGESRQSTKSHGLTHNPNTRAFGGQPDDKFELMLCFCSFPLPHSPFHSTAAPATMETLPSLPDLAGPVGEKHHDSDPVLPTFPSFKFRTNQWVHQVWLNGSSTGGSLASDIIRLISDAHDHDQRIPSFRFSWPPDQVDSVVSELGMELDCIGLGSEARFEYDYQSHVAFLDMRETGESSSHSLSARRINTLVDMGRQRAVLNVDNAAVQERAEWIACFNAGTIKIEGKLYKIPDGSFGFINVRQTIPDSDVTHGSEPIRGHQVSLVCEVS